LEYVFEGGVGLVFMVFILTISIMAISFNPDIYVRLFEKYHVDHQSGLSFVQLDKFAENTTSYLRGSTNNFNIKIDETKDGEYAFNNREVLHMKDVKSIFNRIRYTNYISLFLVALMILAVRLNSDIRKKCFKFQIVFTGFFIGLLFLLIKVDFSKYFIKFHELFFSNDLWLLNPDTDLLIRILPSGFFLDMAVIIIGLFLLLSLIFFGVGLTLNRE
jgi:integral membrane protein (TIGR01906 family)